MSNVNCVDFTILKIFRIYLLMLSMALHEWLISNRKSNVFNVILIWFSIFVLTLNLCSETEKKQNFSKFSAIVEQNDKVYENNLVERARDSNSCGRKCIQTYTDFGRISVWKWLYTVHLWLITVLFVTENSHFVYMQLQKNLSRGKSSKSYVSLNRFSFCLN